MRKVRLNSVERQLRTFWQQWKKDLSSDYDFSGHGDNDGIAEHNNGVGGAESGGEDAPDNDAPPRAPLGRGSHRGRGAKGGETRPDNDDQGPFFGGSRPPPIHLGARGRGVPPPPVRATFKLPKPPSGPTRGQGSYGTVAGLTAAQPPLVPPVPAPVYDPSNPGYTVIPPPAVRDRSPHPDAFKGTSNRLGSASPPPFRFAPPPAPNPFVPQSALPTPLPPLPAMQQPLPQQQPASTNIGRAWLFYGPPNRLFQPSSALCTTIQALWHSWAVFISTRATYV